LNWAFILPPSVRVTLQQQLLIFAAAPIGDPGTTGAAKARPDAVLNRACCFS